MSLRLVEPILFNGSVALFFICIFGGAGLLVFDTHAAKTEGRTVCKVEAVEVRQQLTTTEARLRFVDSVDFECKGVKDRRVGFAGLWTELMPGDTFFCTARIGAVTGLVRHDDCGLKE